MLMKLSSWVTTNATPWVGSYRCHSSSHRILKKNFVVVIFSVWIFGLLQSYPLNRISSLRLKRNVPFEEIRILQPEVRLFLPCCFPLSVIAPLDLAHRNSFASGFFGVSTQNSDRMLFILESVLNVKCISRDHFIGHSQTLCVAGIHETWDVHPPIPQVAQVCRRAFQSSCKPCMGQQIQGQAFLSYGI